MVSPKITEELVSFETAKLAKKKGFDEIVRYLFEGNDMDPGHPIRELNPSPDAQMIKEFSNLVRKYQNDIKHLVRTVGIMNGMGTKELYNSTLPQWIYARPSQDLLERWLREKHGIFLDHKSDEDNTSYLYYIRRKTEYTDMFIAKGNYEQARETALQHALKLLPDDPDTR